MTPFKSAYSAIPQLPRIKGRMERLLDAAFPGYSDPSKWVNVNQEFCLLSLEDSFFEYDAIFSPGEDGKLRALFQVPANATKDGTMVRAVAATIPATTTIRHLCPELLASGTEEVSEEFLAMPRHQPISHLLSNRFVGDIMGDQRGHWYGHAVAVPYTVYTVAIHGSRKHETPSFLEAIQVFQNWAAADPNEAICLYKNDEFIGGVK